MGLLEPTGAMVKWGRSRRTRACVGHRDDLTTVEREELSQLRNEVRVLRQERDILANATALFVKETTR
jgi:transposase